MSGRLELTDEMRAALLVTVTSEDAAFIKRVVMENRRLHRIEEAAREVLSKNHWPLYGGPALRAALEESE